MRFSHHRLAVSALAAAVLIASVAGCSGSSSPDAPSVTPTASEGTAALTPTALSTAAYAASTQKITSDYAVEFRKMGTLISNPAFDNPTWRQNLSGVVASIKAIGVRLRALVPPSCLVEVHAAQLDAASNYDRMIDLLASGVQDADDAALAQSASFLSQGNTQIAQAASLLAAAHC